MNSVRGRTRATSALPALNAPDAFGVPANLLGQHPEEVYGAVGRVVTLSALLEDRQRTLLLQLSGAAPNDFADVGASGVAAELGRIAKALAPAEAEWAALGAVLKRTARALAQRNAVVHNLWPAQGDGRMFGHRQLPGTGARSTTEWPMETLLGLVRELVDLIRVNEVWLARAGARHHSSSRPAVSLPLRTGPEGATPGPTSLDATEAVGGPRDTADSDV